MTIIAIKDLPENVDLDRQAMRVITGGSRTGVRQNFRGHSMLRSVRIIDYPAGRAGNAVADASRRSATPLE